jgi:hypothetical protein
MGASLSHLFCLLQCLRRGCSGFVWATLVAYFWAIHAVIMSSLLGLVVLHIEARSAAVMRLSALLAESDTSCRSGAGAKCCPLGSALPDTIVIAGSLGEVRTITPDPACSIPET